MAIHAVDHKLCVQLVTERDGLWLAGLRDVQVRSGLALSEKRQRRDEDSTNLERKNPAQTTLP